MQSLWLDLGEFSWAALSVSVIACIEGLNSKTRPYKRKPDDGVKSAYRLALVAR